MMRVNIVAALVLLADIGAVAAPEAKPVLPARRYREGETVSYHMRATNRDRVSTLEYEIQADGVVKKTTDGYVEEFAWSGLNVGGTAIALPPESVAFRQILSLLPSRRVGIPDLSKVHPMMIGPITDLLTFYADMLIVHQGTPLGRAGDHFYFKHGAPNSWADGTYVTLGQDSIDFDVTLAALDPTARVATVVVKHVPPAEPRIAIPVEWMRQRVADTRNNWVEVTRTPQGKFAAHIGKETFTAEIKVNLDDGRIVSATLDNPVEVLERECADAALSTCGDPMRYQIRRRVEIR